MNNYGVGLRDSGATSVHNRTPSKRVTSPNGKTGQTQRRSGGSENVSPTKQNVISPTKKQAQEQAKLVVDAQTIKFQIEQIEKLTKELATERAQEQLRKNQLDTLAAQAQAARSQVYNLKNENEELKKVNKELVDEFNKLNEECDALVVEANTELKNLNEKLAQSDKDYDYCLECYNDKKAINLDLCKELEENNKFAYDLSVKALKKEDQLKQELKVAKSLQTKRENFAEISQPLIGLMGAKFSYDICSAPEVVEYGLELFGRHVGLELTFEGFNQLFMGYGAALVGVIAGYAGYKIACLIGPKLAILVSKLSEFVIEISAWLKDALSHSASRYYNISLLVGVLGLLSFYNEAVNSIVASCYDAFNWEMSLYRSDIVDWTLDGANDVAMAFFSYCFGGAETN